MFKISLFLLLIFSFDTFAQEDSVKNINEIDHKQLNENLVSEMILIRKKLGLSGRVLSNNNLINAAEYHNLEMFETGELSHIEYLGEQEVDIDIRVLPFFPVAYAGETVVEEICLYSEFLNRNMQFTYKTLAKHILEIYFNSPIHREILLGEKLSNTIYVGSHSLENYNTIILVGNKNQSDGLDILGEKFIFDVFNKKEYINYLNFLFETYSLSYHFQENFISTAFSLDESMLLKNSQESLKRIFITRGEIFYNLIDKEYNKRKNKYFSYIGRTNPF